MGKLYLLRLLLILIGFFNFSYAQNVNNPSVIISDHNGILNPININCDYNFNDNSCISLTAKYPDIQNPTSYSVSSIPFTPIGDFSEGNEIIIDSDDKWSKSQKIPFNFCFYGNTYNSIVIADNGVISFDTQYAETECPYTIAGFLPDPAVIHNAIFGAYHDMTNDSDVFGCTTDCGQISLYTTGVAPFRKAVINYYRMNHFGCADMKSTLQIVLYETTNIIEIYIKDKPFTCDIANEKRTLVGISNQDGTKGISPEERNTGVWTTQNEAWRFTPTGGSSISVKWYDSNHKEIGRGDSIEICPVKTKETYTVEVNYNICSPLSISSNINIIYSPDRPKAGDIEEKYCYEGKEPHEVVNFEALIPSAIGDQKDIITTLHETAEEASSGKNPLSNLDAYVMNTTSKTFYLRVQKTESCFDTSSLTIKLNKKPVLTEGEAITVCNSELQSGGLIYLPNYNSYLNGYEKWMIIEYFKSKADAETGSNPISTLSFSDLTTIYVRASNQPDIKACYSIIPINFKIINSLDADSQIVELCDSDADKSEIYDLTTYENTVKGKTELSFQYYKNEQDAIAEKNVINNPKNYEVKDNTVIYVKIKKEGLCPTLKTLTFKIKKTAIQDMVTETCAPDGKAVFNLMEYFNNMVDENIILEGFYNTKNEAVDQSESGEIKDPENFMAHAPNSIIYARFFDKKVNCIFIIKITIKVIEQIGQQPSYDICDLDNDGEENFQLNKLNSIFLSSYPSSAITYYSTIEDYNTGNNPITEIIVKKEGATVYVRVKARNTECFFLYRMELNLISTPTHPVKNINVCDIQNDGKENYNLNLIIPYLQIENYTKVRFFKTKEEAYKELNAISKPDSYSVTQADNKIYVRVDFKDNCSQIFAVEFSLRESLQIPEFSPLIICDSDNNGSENVDLSQIINQSGIDVNKISVSFYPTKKGAESQNANERIEAYNSFPVTNNLTTIYVRFEDNNHIIECPTILSITIKMYSLPQIINDELEIYDLKNDGKEFIKLEELNYQLVQNTSGLSFNYFESEQDAIHFRNEIADYTLTPSTELFVRIKSEADCFIIQKINFIFLLSPIVYDREVEICDNNDDGEEIVDLTLYEEILVSNERNIDYYTFEYFTSYEEANNGKYAGIEDVKNFSIKKFPLTVFVKVKNITGCYSIAELTFKAANSISVENMILNLCNDSKSMKEYVDLTSYIPENLNSLTIKYFKTENGANTQNTNDWVENPSNYLATSEQDYVWVRFDNPETGCFTIRYIEINITPLPKIVPGKYRVCDNNFDEKFTLNLEELKYEVLFNPEGYTFTYFNSANDASDDTKKIENWENYDVQSFPKDIYVKATNKFGCSSVTKVTLYTEDKIETNPVIQEIKSCDENFDGITSFDLTQAIPKLTSEKNVTFEFYSTLSEAQNQENPIKDITDYHNIKPNNDKVYVRISSPVACPSLGVINLKVLPVPSSTLEADMKICPDGMLTLDAGSNPSIKSYLWNTGETTQKITVNKPGDYWVTLTGTNGCEITYSTSVAYYTEINISDLLEGNDYITVIADGPGILEYSMDNINWQKSNTFYNLKPGVYTFHVRSLETGCVSPQKKGVIFKVTNFITPNGDSRNDTWKLCGLENFDSNPSKLKIFNRQGKIVHEESSNTCFNWNGSYLGRPLPTTSYWYIIEVVDGRQFTGWITLRNYDEKFR